MGRRRRCEGGGRLVLGRATRYQVLKGSLRPLKEGFFGIRL